MFFQSNEQLVEHLENEKLLDEKLKEAFLNVDRIKFVLPESANFAYFDGPLSIGQGQTISQPTTVAFMLDLLEVKPSQKILDIGAGSGWASCLLGYLVGKNGEVFAYEIKDKVGKFGKENVEKFGFKNTKYFIADAETEWAKNGPYDRIYSGAAFSKIPDELKQQLKAGGILVAPTQKGDVRKIKRTGKGNEFSEDIYPGFVFVPFVSG